MQNDQDTYLKNLSWRINCLTKSKSFGAYVPENASVYGEVNKGYRLIFGLFKDSHLTASVV
jgi:hypothetical protein